MTRSERHCFLKRPLTEDAASKEASRLRRRTGENIHAYRCDECGEWHVGRRSER